MVSADRLTAQANDWARHRGYDGPPLTLNSASRAFSQCGARRVQVVEDGDLLGGFVVPDVTGRASRASAGSNGGSLGSTKLQRFLDMDDEERGFIIAHRPGAVAWVPEFKQAYQNVMRESLGFIDEGVLQQQRGFSLSNRFEYVCLSCKGLARGGWGATDRCCPDYSNYRRTKKKVIFDMIMSHSV